MACLLLHFVVFAVFGIESLGKIGGIWFFVSMVDKICVIH